MDPTLEDLVSHGLGELPISKALERRSHPHKGTKAPFSFAKAKKRRKMAAKSQRINRKHG